MNLPRIFALITGLLLAPITQAALVTWSYVGPDFDYPDPLPSPYSTGDHIEGYITIDDSFLDAAGDGLLRASRASGVQPWLIDFSFTDGVQTIAYGDLPAAGAWSVKLGFVDNVLRAWEIFLYLSPSPPLTGIFTGCGNPGRPIDWCGASSVLTERAEFEGTTARADVFQPALPLWSTSPAGVPAPASVALVVLGLAGIGYQRGRKKRSM